MQARLRIAVLVSCALLSACFSRPRAVVVERSTEPSISRSVPRDSGGAEREYLVEDSLTNIEREFPNLFVRLHRNCLVAQNSIRGFEKRHNEEGESHWVAMLKELPETLPVSRRQQHIVHELGG